jgi:hypothetical protein
MLVQGVIHPIGSTRREWHSDEIVLWGAFSASIGGPTSASSRRRSGGRDRSDCARYHAVKALPIESAARLMRQALGRRQRCTTQQRSPMLYSHCIDNDDGEQSCQRVNLAVVR